MFRTGQPSSRRLLHNLPGARPAVLFFSSPAVVSVGRSLPRAWFDRDVEIDWHQDVPETPTGDNASQSSDLWPQEGQ
jgi:hypothetical protein